ncbi:hypothetical protein Tco_0990824 [Tanacetum coccineum]|uniref:Uncharacterized protein n=1 Tax=Tanacetum coccineum TaxID=301880 RepID=A0ABQ5EYP5_9ASTR
MPELTIFNKPQKGIFDEASYDDEGMVHDFNNLPTEVAVSPIPTLRIHNIHPQSQIRVCLSLSVQTRSRFSNKSEAHALRNLKKIFEALQDDSWVEAMQEELLQNKKDEKGVVVKINAKTGGPSHRQKRELTMMRFLAPVARIEAIRSTQDLYCLAMLPIVAQTSKSCSSSWNASQPSSSTVPPTTYIQPAPTESTTIPPTPKVKKLKRLSGRRVVLTDSEDEAAMQILPNRGGIYKKDNKRRLDAEDVSTGFKGFEDVSTGFTDIKSASEKVSSGGEYDELAAKRLQEELELSEAQKKRMAQVQEAAQFYTEEDWDTIRAKLKQMHDLVKEFADKIIRVLICSENGGFDKNDLKELYRLMMMKYWNNSLKKNLKGSMGSEYYVQYLTVEAAHIYMLTEVKYPLPPRVCKAMLEKKLLGDRKDEIESCLCKMELRRDNTWWRCYALTQQMVISPPCLTDIRTG